MRRTSFLVLLTAYSIFGMSEAFGQTASLEVPVLSPGVHVQGLRVGILTVRYTISVPPQYDPAKPVPLVLALHFSGNPNGAGTSLLSTLVAPAFRDLGAIIVAPDSIGGQWDSAENERAVNALIDGIRKSYNVDSKKIAVTGYSMGGAGAWYFAQKYPLFTAAIPVSGRPVASVSGWRTPVFAVHSRADEVVPFGPVQARIAELRKEGVRAELVVLEGVMHYQTNRFVSGLRQAVPWLKETWR